jgi:hypothetical protein
MSRVASWFLAASLSFLGGCVQTWGLAPPPPAADPRRADDGPATPDDDEVKRLVALAAELDQELVQLEATIAEAQADFDASDPERVREQLGQLQDPLERRLVLSIAIAELRAAIARRRESLADGATPPREPIADSAKELLVHAERRVADARARHDEGLVDGLNELPASDHGGDPGMALAQPKPMLPLETIGSERKPDDSKARGPRKRGRRKKGRRATGGLDALLGLGSDQDDKERGYGGQGAFIEGAAVVGAAQAFDVEAALAPQLPNLATCVPAGRGTERVMVKGRLAPDGRFREVRIADGALTPSARACLAERLRNLRLRVPAGATSMVVSFPLTFGGR